MHQLNVHKATLLGAGVCAALAYARYRGREVVGTREDNVQETASRGLQGWVSVRVPRFPFDWVGREVRVPVTCSEGSVNEIFSKTLEKQLEARHSTIMAAIERWEESLEPSEEHLETWEKLSLESRKVAIEAQALAESIRRDKELGY